VLIILVHTSGFPYPLPFSYIRTIDVVNWFSADIYNSFGVIGVPLFVMLSGALLLNPVKANEPLRVFYKKRFNRIGIPLIFWTIFYFIWAFTVRAKPVTLFNIGQGILDGSDPILWYLYLIVGLYAVTPVLRVLVKHVHRNLFTYLLILWFAGTVITPFIHTFTTFAFNPVMFVFFDWVGYFLLGIYLLKANVRKSIAYLAAGLGLFAAVFGAFLMEATVGELYAGYLHNYMSFNIIIGSAAIFFLLLSIPPNRIESHIKTNRVIHWISGNTLPIYLIHIVVLEMLTAGYFGAVLYMITGNLVVDVPILALIVFGVSAALVYVLKKIPYVEKLIG
jgi:surface polysaccharide O-acyltransferase-like enzyme